ncbi:cytidine deaminase 1-like [Elaeis guineensis]|uniref:cytidine deaminase 1-like n=1 Tax=Elaeis guineensis var. tenera TaxID=51953 RepID=UPI003C6D2396
MSGRIYIGVNVEFPGLPLHHCIHAEQLLITNTTIHGEAGIQCITVSSAPCGHCCQFLKELCGAVEIQILMRDLMESYWTGIVGGWHFQWSHGRGDKMEISALAEPPFDTYIFVALTDELKDEANSLAGGFLANHVLRDDTGF